MATISDVEDALANIIAAALYPNAGAPPSIVGFPVKIYPGWPDPQTLDLDLVETAQDKPTAAHVSVYPLPTERNTTRYPATREELPAPATTYTLVAAGQVITVGGAAPATYVAQNLAAFINGKPYVVQATSAQTPAQVAAALCAAIQAGVPAVSVTGAQITLPASARIGALRVGSTGATVREVGRQEKQFQLSAWASSPASRSAVADAFDPLIKDTDRIAMPDGSVARLIYRGAREDDFMQKQRVYRRSLIVTVEYATLLTEAAAQMVAGEVDSTVDTTPLPPSYS